MLVGSAQRAVTLGRLDIAYAVTTLARFAALPRKGHLEATLRVFRYLKKTKNAKILFDSRLPDYSGYKFAEHEWEGAYPGAHEEIDKELPEPKGKPVVLSMFVDADHARDEVTRRSTTGILAFLNCTPIRWYCKRQATVESSTFGSEIVAVRIAAEMIIELRYGLHALGMPILVPSYLFGDNQSVITNTTLPSSSLKKKHNAIAYHKVRE